MSVRTLFLVIALTGFTAGAAHAQFDHLTCYKTRDSQTIDAQVTLDAIQNQFDPAGGCRIKGKARLFCVPTDKTVTQLLVNNQPTAPLPISGPTPVPDRVCYKVKCPTAVIGDELVSDQFGSRILSGFKVSLLCTPAVKGPPPTTTTTIVTTTTTLSIGTPCTSNAQCGGTNYCQTPDGNCAGQGTCQLTPSTCPALFDPVCGCNGVTYTNSCYAAQANVSVASAGACCAPNLDFCTTNTDCCSGACASGTCFACVIDGDCGAGRYCSGGQCLNCKAAGQSCVGSNECCSTSCVGNQCQ